MDGLTYFVYDVLKDSNIAEAENVSRKVNVAFIEHPNWARSEKEHRELRQGVTFAIYSVESDPDKVASVVDHLFTLLLKAQGVKA